MDKTTISEFWRGRVVFEAATLFDDNPGHVVGFVRNTDGKFYIRVEFVNGDRYNLLPDELEFQ
jgi:hypothetical protein